MNKYAWTIQAFTSNHKLFELEGILAIFSNTLYIVMETKTQGHFVTCPRSPR